MSLYIVSARLRASPHNPSPDEQDHAAPLGVPFKAPLEVPFKVLPLLCFLHTAQYHPIPPNFCKNDCKDDVQDDDL